MGVRAARTRNKRGRNRILCLATNHKQAAAAVEKEKRQKRRTSVRYLRHARLRLCIVRRAYYTNGYALRVSGRSRDFVCSRRFSFTRTPTLPPPKNPSNSLLFSTRFCSRRFPPRRSQHRFRFSLARLSLFIFFSRRFLTPSDGPSRDRGRPVRHRCDEGSPGGDRVDRQLRVIS